MVSINNELDPYNARETLFALAWLTASNKSHYYHFEIRIKINFPSIFGQKWNQIKSKWENHRHEIKDVLRNISTPTMRTQNQSLMKEHSDF